MSPYPIYRAIVHDSMARFLREAQPCRDGNGYFTRVNGKHLSRFRNATERLAIIFPQEVPAVGQIVKVIPQATQIPVPTYNGDQKIGRQDFVSYYIKVETRHNNLVLRDKDRKNYLFFENLSWSENERVVSHSLFLWSHEIKAFNGDDREGKLYIVGVGKPGALPHD